MAYPLGEVALNHIVGQGFDVVWLVAVVEVLEGAKADMALGDAADGGAGLHFFAVDLGLAVDQGQCSGGGYAQTVHGFGAEVFADT